MVIYSKALRDRLIRLGYKEYKEPEDNISNPCYKVWFFPSIPEIEKEILKYREERNAINKTR